MTSLAPHRSARTWTVALMVTLTLTLWWSGVTPAQAQQRDRSGLDAARILHEHNRIRVAQRLEPLAGSPTLERIAQEYARELARRQVIDHVGEDGSNLTDRANKGGYPFGRIGENLAFGHRDVTSLMRDWMNSPGHQANILQPAYAEAGIGMARDARGVLYVVVNFGTPRNRAPVRTMAAPAPADVAEPIEPAPPAAESTPTALKQAIDALRAEAGAAPLATSAVLNRAAVLHARDLAQRGLASPTGSDGATVSKRVRDLGYRPRAVAQLVARGAPTVEELIALWTKSAGQRRILLDDYEELGLARAEDDRGVPHWCVVLARPQTTTLNPTRATPPSDKTPNRP